jgi:hypothetical protein
VESGAGAAGAAAAGAAAGAWAEDESAGEVGVVCAPAASAIANDAPAIDRRITVVFEYIDTIPPGKDL